MATAKNNKGIYWLFYSIHLCMVVMAFAGPFLINWPIMISIYMMISIQFLIFKGCLFNKTHGLSDSNATFYSDLLWKIGISHSDKVITKFVRRYLYPLLAMITFFWQYILMFDPIWF